MTMKAEVSGRVPDIQGQGSPLKGVGNEPVSGEVLRWKGSISFLGDVDPEKGTLTKDGFVGYIKDRIIVFEEGAGSTVGSYVVYNLRLFGNAPRGMVMSRADAIITIGCILADIPLLSRVDRQKMENIDTGDILEMDPHNGFFSVWKEGWERRP